MTESLIENITGLLRPEMLSQQMKWRYATQGFDPSKKISDDHWKALEDTLLLSPSSFGLQPWKFLVVDNPDARKALMAASWNQKQVADASHFVVFAIKKNVDVTHVDKYISRLLEVRGGTIDDYARLRRVILGALKYMEGEAVNHWAQRQVYIALGNLMTAAAAMGIDTCPMEGFVPAKYDEILNLALHGWAATVACAVGYRAETDKHAHLPKVRFKPDDVIKHI